METSLRLGETGDSYIDTPRSLRVLRLDSHDTRLHRIRRSDVAEGFVASGIGVGIKTYGVEPRYDVGLRSSTSPCLVAGVFTRTRCVERP